MVTDMASIPKQEIGDFVGNASSSRSEVQRAIDFFLQGFEAL
ncbi:MAG: hypothetical protein IPP04_06920 [Saprospiraceae bacterium]|nr:hypothetical protein [Saprospiraceae bacterium]